MLVIAMPVWAQNADSATDVEGDLIVQAYSDGDRTHDVRLGLGGTLDHGMGYVYLGHFRTGSRASVRSGAADIAPLPNNQYRSTRLGLYSEGHDRETGEGFGFGLYGYRNESDLLIDRAGLGATLDLAYIAATGLRLSAGADLMPGYLSNDRDADVALEYEWHADIRYRLHRRVTIGLNWRNGRTNDSTLNTEQYEEALLGLRLSF
ncbi:hypothetical protein DES49_0640 [Halospina denitrificans]|uniref:YfaZ n=1 Tax=Halospina denitrificans TaxID=332522 RepID=A0A4R7K117_9GAMM|nr:hypothetical protein [Halospina denitrificans]TDT44530.1 hypothetical protein DES49_0640 [Halospina denitrificans]